jgi:parallel beta-helix repeat protein
MLNNRRRFAIWADMAAALVLLAGGANAGVPPPVTVRCVPNVSINPGCVVAYGTISLAVTNALSGDAIFVGPGTYDESVTISTPGLSLFGAQAGNDARVDRHGPESIVNGMGNPAFIVFASGVVIDGFTVTGGTAAAADPYPGGILVASTSPTTTTYFAQVLNNILEGNGTGVYLYQANSPLVEHNLFRNNTAPDAGAGVKWVGLGVVSEGVTSPVINENEFTGNKMAAIFVGGGSNSIITNNTSENDGSFVLFAGTNQCLFSHNQGKNFGHKGLPIVVSSTPYYADAAVDVGPGNSNLMISDNDLEKGEAPIGNGIAFTTVFASTPLGSAANFNVNLRNNKIKGFPENGIVAEEQSGGTLTGSWIGGNVVRDNGLDGIVIDVNNHNISVFDNEAEGNQGYDCHDTSTGYGTLGRGDTWFNNIGNSSSPAGLCTPGRGHDHD